MKKLIQVPVVATGVAAPDGRLIDALKCGHAVRSIINEHGRAVETLKRGCRRCTRAARRAKREGTATPYIDPRFRYDFDDEVLRS